MKRLILAMILLHSLNGIATASESHEAGNGTSGMLFKSGQGLTISKTMAESIKLKTTEVIEERMTPIFFAELQSLKRGKELSGWVNGKDVSNLKEGDKATLKIGTKIFGGTVTQIKKSSYAAGGDYEVIVQADEAVAPGTPVYGAFAVPLHESALVIPKSSLLTTAEGTFVYAKSGDFYVRTTVKVGHMTDQKIEILDGLYSGDEVVTTPVMQLWLAELQAIRGGQSCADGH